MWKEQMIKDIEKLKFNPNRLFKNPLTNEFIVRNEYISLVLDDFLAEQKKKIESFGGLERLEFLETRLGSIMHITLNQFNQLDCNEELAKAILTYVYWKYKNPKSKLKVSFNINHVKKVFGIKYNVLTEEIVEPIKTTTKCYICNSNANIYIPSYKRNRIKFKCEHCEHLYEIEAPNNDIDIPYVQCDCEYCTNIKNRIFEKGIEWFYNLKSLGDHLVKNTDNKIIGLPDDKTMKNHFGTYIYSKKYNKEIDIHSLKEFMNYKPKSIDALCDFINDNSNYFDLTSKLKDNNIIYNAKQKRHISMENLCMDYILGINQNEPFYKFEEFSNHIMSKEFIYGYDISKSDNGIKFRHYNSILGGINCKNFNIINDIDYSELEKYIYEDVSIINPYFENYYLNPNSNYINELFELVQDCSELDLKLILETAKAIKSVEK